MHHPPRIAARFVSAGALVSNIVFTRSDAAVSPRLLPRAAQKAGRGGWGDANGSAEAHSCRARVSERTEVGHHGIDTLCRVGCYFQSHGH